uniref:(northern house mosquito) hypothetical protein n=1 Tax=Culex pipiens TaxID=7175 RepID=A0A8D8INY9_CULPI
MLVGAGEQQTDEPPAYGCGSAPRRRLPGDGGHERICWRHFPFRRTAIKFEADVIYHGRFQISGTCLPAPISEKEALNQSHNLPNAGRLIERNRLLKAKETAE